MWVKRPEHTPGFFYTRSLNVTSVSDAVFNFLSFQPNVVVHAAAERRPDAVEKQEEAVKRLNVDATTTLCEEASVYCIKFSHMPRVHWNFFLNCFKITFKVKNW